MWMKTSIEVSSSNIVASVTGAHKMIITNPRGESLHKEEQSVSEAERGFSIFKKWL